MDLANILFFLILACNDVAERKTCAYYKGIGYCTQAAVDWMKKNCAKTCSHCTTGGGGGDGGGEGGGGGKVYRLV